MKRASVSVVIPSYNSAGYVTQAVESVLAQTVAPAEIIVVDDGSTDDTAARLAAYGSGVRCIYQDNAGVSAARNRGIEAANGDFVAFLDADDLWHPQKLEIQMHAFARVPAAGLIGTRSFFLPGSFALLDAEADQRLVRVTWRQLAVRNHLCASSVIVRRSILNIAGMFDRSMQGPEDHDMWLRIAQFSTILNIDLPLTGYRIVPGSVSRQPQRCHEGMQRVLRKLDEQEAWKRRWLLRRKAWSHVQHTAAYLYSAAGKPREALKHSIQSFLTYPLPYRRCDVLSPIERPRRMAVALLRWLRLKPLDPQSVALRRALQERAASAAKMINGDVNDGRATA